MSEHAMSTMHDDWVELADRSGDGLDVRLLWNRSTDRKPSISASSARSAAARSK